jgi:FkbM family methyltransferase
MNLIGRLQRNPWINAAVKHTGVNRVVDRLLQTFPIPRRTRSGLIYRIDSVPSWVVAQEIFGTDVYSRAIEEVRPGCFISLGANVGYFPLLVSEIVGSKAIRGVLVEPNPELHSRIEYHLGVNGLHAIHVIKGIVGDSSRGEADFFINPSHIASAVTPRFNPNVPVGGEVRKIRVPVVNLMEEWRMRHGSCRIDLLKIDIEGAEVDFLESHPEVLSLADAVLIEWHKWATTLAEIQAILGQAGLRLKFLSQEDANAGTALFRR